METHAINNRHKVSCDFELQRRRAASGPGLRTDGVGLAVLGGHHERGLPRGVHAVHLGVVAQQQLQTLHVVGEGGRVERSPAEGNVTRPVFYPLI